MHIRKGYHFIEDIQLKKKSERKKPIFHKLNFYQPVPVKWQREQLGSMQNWYACNAQYPRQNIPKKKSLILKKWQQQE